MKTLLILPILSTFLFVGCPDSKKDDSITNIASLYSLVNGIKFSRADIQTNTSTAQIIPFKTSSSTQSAYIYVNVTTGQKVSVSSVTSNLTNFFPDSYLTCSAKAIFTSINFTTSTATNITFTAKQNFEGLIQLDVLKTDSPSKPGDVTVQILP